MIAGALAGFTFELTDDLSKPYMPQGTSGESIGTAVKRPPRLGVAAVNFRIVRYPGQSGQSTCTT